MFALGLEVYRETQPAQETEIQRRGGFHEAHVSTLEEAPVKKSYHQCLTGHQVVVSLLSG